MAQYCADLPAKKVDALLKKTLAELHRAERNAVLWFADILRRELYRELGYSSIQQYAAEALGFSENKTYQFVRLATSLRALPKLHRSVADGQLGWTKAREVAKVASPETQTDWIREAKRSSSRELERKVQVAKRQARAARMADPNQQALPVAPPVAPPVALPVAPPGPGSEAAPGAANPAAKAPGPKPSPGPAAMVLEVPATLTFRLSADQMARYEALLEQIGKQTRNRPRRRQGAAGRVAARPLSREELLLAALEDHLTLLRAGDPAGQEAVLPRGKNAGAATGPLNGTPDRPGPFLPRGKNPEPPPYQIIVYECERCGRGEVHGPGRTRELSPAALARAACDARIQKEGKPNRATIPPARRRQILARDRHRCRMRGCGQTRFLEVHHLNPRANGGKNDPDNLVTLCASCHQLLHERFLGGERRQEHHLMKL